PTPTTLQTMVLTLSNTVDQGTVTFRVYDPYGNEVGQPVTSGTVSGANALASAAFTVPAGLRPGFYSVLAVYSGSQDFQGGVSSREDLGALVVQSPAPADTLTSVADVLVTSSPAPQTVTLSASVTSGGVGIDGGTVTFTVFQFGSFQLGLPVVSGPVS